MLHRGIVGCPTPTSYRRPGRVLFSGSSGSDDLLDGKIGSQFSGITGTGEAPRTAIAPVRSNLTGGRVVPGLQSLESQVGTVYREAGCRKTYSTAVVPLSIPSFIRRASTTGLTRCRSDTVLGLLRSGRARGHVRMLSITSDQMWAPVCNFGRPDLFFRRPVGMLSRKWNPEVPQISIIYLCS